MHRKIFNLPIIIYFDEDTYIAKCPIIQGAFAEGETPDEALKELIDVMRMIFEYRKERNEIIEQLKDFSSVNIEKIFTTIPFSI